MNQFGIDADALPRVCPNLEMLRQVYLQHRAELCAYLVKKLGLNKGEAEDAVHGAFEKAMHMRPEEFALLRNARAFFYKTAYHAAVDYQRHQSVSERHADGLKVDWQSIADELDPYRRLVANQELNVLASALKKMPEKRRSLIVMSRFDGLSYAEIARRVNLSETVVRKHVARALNECIRAVKTSNGEVSK